MSRVVLDLGHHGLTGGRPGAEHGDRREVAIVRRYTIAAADHLEAAGVAVDFAGQGRYSSRQAQAARDKAAAYVACHVNAAWRNGFGASVYHSKDAASGGLLAYHLASHLRRALGQCRTWPTSPDDWTKNAHSLVWRAQSEGVAAVVYEPAFIDGPAEQLALLDDPGRLGGCLAAGILDYLEARRDA